VKNDDRQAVRAYFKDLVKLVTEVDFKMITSGNNRLGGHL
jgi:hypothetical protein